MTDLSQDYVLDLIAAAVESAGGPAAFARKVGVTTRQVDFVIKGHREPRGAILAAVGIERLGVYRRVVT